MSTLNLLLENLDPLAQLLLQAMFKTLWQGMLIVALAWTLLRIFKGASATTRHAVWLVSLLVIGALPFVAIATKRTIENQASPVQATGQVIATQPRISNPPVNYPQTNVVEKSLTRQPPAPLSLDLVANYDRAAQVDQTSRLVTLAESARVAPVVSINPQPVIKKSFWQRGMSWLTAVRWKMLLACVWLLGVFLMVGRVAGSYYSLFKLRHKLKPALAEQEEGAMYLASLFGVRRRVRLFTSASVTMPMTIGSFKPLIVLPPDLAQTLSTTEFDSVVAHELAHIKRWDYLTNLLQKLVQAFLFFHPAVWLIGRQLMIERELACDDWAVKMCEPRRYASCLTRLVELLGDSRPLAAAAGILFGKHVISRRVEMILNRNRNATTAVSKPAVAYVIGLAALLIAACSMLSPVIAVPLGQQKAKQQKKETKVTTPAPNSVQVITLPPSADAPLLPDEPMIFDLADVVEVPSLPEPDAAVLADLLAIDQDGTRAPVAPVAAIAPGVTWGQGAVVAPEPWPAPLVEYYAAAGQDGKNRTPVIPEAELLSLLTDIVKRDADPKVRAEALQGIYRMRSDAANDTLLQLYDSTTDPKTKSEIIAYMIRRNGDNTKAIAKLTQIAKNETNEDLRNRAIRYLGAVKGDAGADNLISIYDNLQDQKMKQYVIRSLAYNKSPKAIEKLKQIAKNDADPTIRSAAIRSLYSVDSRLYLETIPPGAKVGLLDGEAFERMRDKMGEWRFEGLENFRLEGLDKFRLELLPEDLRIEIPKLELRLKELQDQIRKEQNLNLVSPVEGQLRSQLAKVQAQLEVMGSQYTKTHPIMVETRALQRALERQLNQIRSLQTTTPKAVTSPSYQGTPAPKAKPAQTGSVAVVR